MGGAGAPPSSPPKNARRPLSQPLTHKPPDMVLLLLRNREYWGYGDAACLGVNTLAVAEQRFNAVRRRRGVLRGLGGWGGFWG